MKIFLDKWRIPSYNTKAVCNSGRIWGYSSAGRALEWHSRGQRFDPAYLHQKPSKSSDFGGFFCISPNFSRHFLIHKKCIRKGNCTSKYAKLNSSGNTTDIKNTRNIMRHKVLDGKMSMHKNSQLSIIFF